MPSARKPGKSAKQIKPIGRSPHPLPLPEEARKSDYRWTPKRKLAVVEAVMEGRIGIQMALKSYRLTKEEFNDWIRLAKIDGTRALRTTRAQVYRRKN